MSHEPSVVLVTGASSGIGRATALLVAEAGDHVVLVARGKAALDETEAACQQAGAASTMVVPTDVGDDDAVASCVEQVLDRHGRLDVVISAAGVVAYGRVDEVPAKVFDGVLRTNVSGSANVARHTLPVLREQGHGSLVLVGSVVGHIGVPAMTAYVVSKWAIRSLATQLQLENRDVPGLDISYVAPGGVDTPIYQQGANYAGFLGRPPPPVASPERIARQIVRRLDHAWLPSQLTVANEVIRFGFSVLPGVYNRIIGTAFPLGATDLTTPVAPNEGNVLTSGESGNRVRGDQGNALVGIGRNVLARLREPAR
jgi:NAD(P)-dependent dehydrogenase (short-subunit alcohol dehydrogenase family)